MDVGITSGGAPKAPRKGGAPLLCAKGKGNARPETEGSDRCL